MIYGESFKPKIILENDIPLKQKQMAILDICTAAPSSAYPSELKFGVTPHPL